MAEPKIAIDILVNCQTGTNNLKKFNKELDKTVNTATKATKATNWLSKGFMRFAGAFIGIQTVKGLVNTGSRIQLVQKSIEGLTKSTQDWQYIQQQAFKTGTEIEVVAKGYRNFFSSAKMAGFGKGGIQSMYADVLLATRAIGASTQQTEGALLALEQMISKGKVSMEELRRQLGNAIPGAFEIGAKAMNMTTAEFNDFVKAGKLASVEFVPKFIKALKDAYADGFKDIEQTVSVAQVRLSNSWKLLQADIMSGETGKSFASALNTLRESLDSPEFRQFIKYLGDIFNIIVKIFNFAIKNMRLVLMLLGVRGFYGLLAKNALLFRVLNMNIGRAIGMLILMGKHGKFTFAGLTAGAKAFMTTLYRILLPLLLIEDVVLGIGQKFLGWNVKSLTGDYLLNFAKPGLAKFPNYRNREIQKSPFDNTSMDKLLPFSNPVLQTPDLFPHSNNIPGTSSFQKSETNNNKISMGDVNITIDGAKDSIQTANAVKDILLSLFKGENLMLDTESAVV